MFDKLIRLTVFNCLTAFLLAYVQYTYGFHEYVAKADTTYLARFISIIYFVTSFYIVVTVIKGKEIGEDVIDFVSKLSMGLGLIGAVIGMSQSYKSLETFDPSQVTDLIRLIGEVASAGPITTAFGIGVWLLLESQKFFVELRLWEDAK
ncbi:hypothetical protein EVB55_150 [Rhizobium phage RHph_Y68]|uniref:MotA/TolQ/ExbB proton channel domain-containing protein n=1 Tax=Rhizobium phage RHph_Y68 TaxID=2509787 RepID=A0A7S5URQ3_9CAUD|nr:hypothetical protein PP934_gp150 [Rhizobium phage RHph_Y68]QIG68085.1 hypothetical protein EVB55_150 [Rhizobium phage RHph_Y68]